MIAPAFETLSATSRIWIYQSSRELAFTEAEQLSNALEDFITGWNSHGNELKGAFEIVENRFIVIAVDESVAGASGCSIDSSVRVLQEFGQQHGIDLMDKSHVNFKSGENIQTVPFTQVKGLVAAGTISANTLVYDISLNQLDNYLQGWPKPASVTWISRFLS